MTRLHFSVPGVPAPGGSKKAFIVRTKSGAMRANVVEDAKDNAPWRATVALAARQAMGSRGLLEGPLKLSVDFRMPRAKGHYRANGGLRDSAPRFHTKKPDRTKMLRALEDALTGIVWHDDTQVVSGEITKRYAGIDETPGASVTVAQLEATIDPLERAVQHATYAMLAADGGDCLNPHEDHERCLAADRLGRAQFDLDAARAIAASNKAKATP